MTRVLVVDDSPFMRTVVGDVLEKAGFDVETAEDGEEAVDVVGDVDPDVVTMDVEMPGMDGIETVERIMRTNPTSILMVSAHTADGAEATLDALERGAVDFLQKPGGSHSFADLADELVEKVEAIADADVSTLALARSAAAVHSQASRVTDAAAAGTAGNRATRTAGTPASAGRSGSSTATSGGSVEGTGASTTDDDYLEDPTIVVGASTGGPKIVECIFASLPVELGAKLLVVQHMPAEFTGRFAERLDSIADYDVREAAEEDRVGAGEALVARGGRHLEVVHDVDGCLRVRRTDGERVHGVKPAIDVTMRTAANVVSDPLVGVVLTGMGTDGADGIRAIKDAGGRTIAQDEATSPVFGIPKKAIETGCVDDVRPAESIVDGIREAVRGETNG